MAWLELDVEEGRGGNGPFSILRRRMYGGCCTGVFIAWDVSKGIDDRTSFRVLVVTLHSFRVIRKITIYLKITSLKN